MKVDVKGVIAVLVVLGSFGLVAPYVIQQHAPDHDVLLFVSAALMLVLGYFFGHINGAQTALANSAMTLAQQAIEKRSATLVPVATVPMTPAAPGPPAPSS